MLIVSPDGGFRQRLQHKIERAFILSEDSPQILPEHVIV